VESISVRQVVFVRFPFLGLSDSKLRPAPVLAQANREDWWLCQITSKEYQDPYAIALFESDFENQALPFKSYIHPSKFFTAHSSLIQKTVGLVKLSKHQRVIDKMVTLLQLGHYSTLEIESE